MRTRRVSSLALCLALGSAAVPAAQAGRAGSWSAASGVELEAGTLEGTAIDEQGRLVVARELETLWGPESGIVWDLARARGGGAFVGLSSPARVLLLVDGKEPALWFSGDEESLVAALLPDGEGGVYFGLSPAGRLYHASARDAVRDLASVDAEFVWALESSTRGSVYVGTGEPGQVLEWRPGSEPELIYDAGDDPVRSLLASRNGGVYAGTAGEGRVIRIDAEGKPFVLLDAEEPEIVSLLETERGEVFALAARGAKQVSAVPPTARGPVETVRVVAAAGEGDDLPSPETEAQTDPGAPRVGPQRFSTPAGAVLYRITNAGDVRRVWEAPNEVPFTLAAAGEGAVLVATGDRGRVWQVDARGRAAVVTTVPSDQASALAGDLGGPLLIGGTTDARVERLGPGLAERGRYSTPVIDARTLADWGQLTHEAELPRGTKLRAWLRVGNTAEPDATWSDWIEVGSEPSGDRPELPPTRWAQARFELQPSSRGDSPLLGRIELFYNTRNREPVIEELNVEVPGVVWTRTPVQSMQVQGPSVADDPVARDTVEALSGARMTRPVRKSYELGARTATWRATDPDGDVLQYRLEVQAEGSAAWVLLARNLDEEFLAFDTRGFPDGTYRLRLTVDDGRDNPGEARLADRELGRAFLVDNTRPSLREPSIRREPGGHAVRFVAADGAGRVASVEIAVDGGGWQPIDPLDGVADSAEEAYEAVVGPPELREAVDDEVRTLRVRVTDSAGNLGGDAWPLD